MNVPSNGTVNGRPAVPAVAATFGRFDLIPKLMALKTVEVPQVPGLDAYVRDRKAAIVLGKALFWDAKVGSDGNACASCHREENVMAAGRTSNAKLDCFRRHVDTAGKHKT